MASIVERIKEIAYAFITPFFLLAAIWQAWIITIFSVGVTYEDSFDVGAESFDPRVDRYYTFQSDVAVMIFVGFGFLMTFLKKYGYSAVGYNFFFSAIAVQWSILCLGFLEMAYEHEYHKIKLDLIYVVDALFGAGAVMITYGALLGKTTPFQLLVITILEIAVYSVNFYLVYKRLQAIDIGGSMTIHLFGAYFGLACSWIVSKSETKNHELNGADRTGDLFAMVGTLFLWLFWPSFNGAFAYPGAQFRVVINTLLSLTGSCTVTFILSYLFHGKKFSMVDVQNATLAGGVAVGSSADLLISPPGALGLGMVAGALSTIGFNVITPALAMIGLQDTCGVHNLHGMPGVLGALAGIISPAIANHEETVYGIEFASLFPRGSNQAAFQTAALFTSWGMAIAGGIVTGIIIRFLTPYPEKPFDDSEFWVMEGEEGEDKYADHAKENKA